jgi:endoglucanase
LVGGYFDAGDHVKFGFPGAFFITMLNWGLVDFLEGYESAGQKEYGYEAVRWGLDFIVKAHTAPNEFYGQAGDGNADHAFWGRPEDWSQGPRPSFKITTDAPGSDLAGEAAAALASGYLVFRDVDAAYANTLLEHARQLYDFANDYQGSYTVAIPAGNFYSSTGFFDEIAWAGAWLYRATNEDKYLQNAEKLYDDNYFQYENEYFGWDSKGPGLQVILAKATGNQKYLTHLESTCDKMVYQLARTPKGLVFVQQWGSLRHSSNLAFLCLAVAELGVKPQEYRAFGKEQIGYALGDTGRSFVVGFGNNPPTQPHHRAASCPDRPAPCGQDELTFDGPSPQTLFGALVGGPGSQDEYIDDREDYIHNEVATDYNAGFQSALAALQKLKASGQLP